MNLVLDFGNTRIKAATYSNGSMVDHIALGYESSTQIVDWIKVGGPYDGILVSSVKQLSENTPQQIINCLPSTPIILSDQTPLPIRNNYRSPETLGNDRLAAAVAAHNLYPTNNVLVIDIGTAITFDLTTRQGEFVGGNISPGSALRIKSLHNFTSKLPLVEANFDAPLIGTNTEEAIQSGVFQGIAAEIDGYIDKLSSKIQSLVVILTGGDAIYFVEKLKNRIFANHNLVLDGLNLILDFNKSVN